MDRIAVLIPCYNEEATIEKVVQDWREALPDATIYVYDNNSSDATAFIADRAGAIVRHETKRGKGNVIRRMFREIDAQCYIMVDGDDTYPATAGRDMTWRVLENDVDMVVGDRLSSTYYKENKRPFHNIGNDLVRFLVNKLFHGEITDIMTGCRAFSYEFVKTFPVMSKGFEIETEMTVHALSHNMKVMSIPIKYRDRPAGSVSKLNTYADGAKVLRTINDLHRSFKPFQHMLIGSVLSGAVSVISFMIGCQRGWSRLLSVFAFLSGCFSFLFYLGGRAMELIALEDKRNFEYEYVRVHEKKKEGSRWKG